MDRRAWHAHLAHRGAERAELRLMRQGRLIRIQPLRKQLDQRCRAAPMRCTQTPADARVSPPRSEPGRLGRRRKGQATGHQQQRRLGAAHSG
eukprot:scaffold5096_cov116-Isochrysis_galbana.AAC.8